MSPNNHPLERATDRMINELDVTMGHVEYLLAAVRRNPTTTVGRWVRSYATCELSAEIHELFFIAAGAPLR